MYAIIATGGKQYTVSEGDTIRVEKLAVNAGDTVTFDQVLFVNNGEAKVGEPTVAGATVTASVVEIRRLSFTSTRERLDITRRMVIDRLTQKLRLKRLMLNFCMDVCEVCYS